MTSVFGIEEQIKRETLFSVCFMLRYCLVSSSTLKMRRYVPPKRRLTSARVHGVIYQKTELFLVTAVRTSDPTGN
jgi:hypothetical protein